MEPLWKNAGMDQNAKKDKTCWVIVGGRKRLGKFLAEDLSRDHALVLTSSKPWDQKMGLNGLSNQAHIQTLQWDAHNPALGSRMMADLDALEGEGWRISGVVLAAGDFPEMPLGTWTQENLEAAWRVNLGFPFLCAQAMAPRMVEGACFQILLDTAIHRPWLKRLPYSAAKAGLSSLVAGLAQLLAPRVRVVGHALGTLLPAEDSDPDFLADRTLLKRIGDPADLCRAVRYAAESPFLTGEILTLDGGRRWR
jgi:NAD(P)-dependent dehydrogenase (short-subunit alcohol dehydrogenase family)